MDVSSRFAAHGAPDGGHLDMLAREATPIIATHRLKEPATRALPPQIFAEVTAWGFCGAEIGKKVFPEKLTYSKNNVMAAACDPRVGSNASGGGAARNISTPQRLSPRTPRVERHHPHTIESLERDIAAEQALHAKFSVLHPVKTRAAGAEDETTLLKRAAPPPVVGGVGGRGRRDREGALGRGSERLVELPDLIPKELTSPFVAALRGPSRRVLQMQTLASMEVPLGGASGEQPPTDVIASTVDAAGDQSRSPREPPVLPSWMRSSGGAAAAAGASRVPRPPILKNKCVDARPRNAPGAAATNTAATARPVSWKQRYADLRDQLDAERRLTARLQSQVEKEKQLRLSTAAN